MSEPLRLVGFFRELRHGRPDGPSLRQAVHAEADIDEARVVEYLRSGSTITVAGRLTSDVLSGSPDAVLPLGVLTDGVWIWPADLEYYVEQYHARLPSEFLEHAKRLEWRPPVLSEGQLGDLIAKFPKD